MIRRGQAAALFNIEKNNRLREKAFALCGHGGVARVEAALLCRYCFVFEFATERAAVKKQKTESLGTQEFALPQPGICLFSRRRAQPVAAESKSLSQYRKSGLTRKNVQVKAQIRTLRCGTPPVHTRANLLKRRKAADREHLQRGVHRS